jgi:hypothetical protein
MEDTPENRSGKLPPEKSTFREAIDETLASQEPKTPGNKVIGSLDNDNIPIRIQFEPIIGRYLERLMNFGFGREVSAIEADSLDDDELALALMLQYYVLISGGYSDVRELESAFVNRRRDADVNPGFGTLFSGITLFEMIKRATRVFENAKTLPEILGRSDNYRSGVNPLEKFSDDEIAELTFVTHASITGQIRSGLQVGNFFKHLATEYEGRR